MKNMFKRFMAAALLLCMLLTVFAPATAKAATSGTTGDRYNIMMVIDGSGSLTGTASTDPYGMRYELIGELMGILEDDGHNIGAIVFSAADSKKLGNPTDAVMKEGIMLNTGLLSLDNLAPDGRKPKDYLEAEIKRIGVNVDNHGGTDIGTALKAAQEQLSEMKAQNGLESVVFLFTDGVTEFYGYAPEALKKSKENRDSATLKMSQEGIRLFGAFLNNRGKLEDPEMENLVCAANGISPSSPEFQYSYIEIDESSKIHAASTSFLKFLGYIDDDEDFITLYDDYDGTFTIPGIGVEEMNIRLYSPAGEKLPDMAVTLTKPDGTIYNSAAEKKSRTYQVYKLEKPDSGVWKIHIEVPEGEEVEYIYMPVVSLYIDSLLESNPAPQNLYVNQNPAFTCLLAQGGNPVTNPAAYFGYDCTLVMKNVTTGDTVTYDVQANTSGSLMHNILLDIYGTFEVKTVFTCDKIVVESAPIVLDLTNRVPTVASIPEQKLTCGLFQPQKTELDLTKYFSDPEDGSNMAYAVDSVSGCDAAAISFSGGVMTMKNGSIGNGSFTVSATDSQGASVSKTVCVQTKNVTVWYIIGLVILLIIIAIIVIAAVRRKHRNRPNGELSLTFEMPFDGQARQIVLGLHVPGTDTTSKTNLYKLVQDALRNENTKIENGVYARDVMSFLMNFSSELSEVSVYAAIKKVNKKDTGAIGVKHNKKNSVLYNGFADFFLKDATFTVEFEAEPDIIPNPFDDGPFAPAGKKKADNFFEEQDDIFTEPVQKKAKKPAKPSKKDDFGSSDSDVDFF